jgi:type VI secretion system secreted protein VgrG
MSGSASDVATRAWVEIDFSPDPGFTLIFDEIDATEELGRPFLYRVSASAGTRIANVNSLIGSTASIWLSQSTEGKEDKYFNAVVTKVVATGQSGGAYRYKLELRPWVWLLSRVTDCRIFNNMSAFDIISKVFRDAGFSDFSDSRSAAAGDTVLEYCVQYRESSLDFVHRLMEQYGIYYYFTHTKSKHTLVFADDPNSHTDQGDPISFAYDQTEIRTVGDHVWAWSAAMALESGKYTFQDYDFTKPSADLTSKTTIAGSHDSYKDLEIYEYPGLYIDTGVGQKATDLHLQAITRNRLVISAESNARGLHSGSLFTLKDHPASSENKTYLIIKSHWHMGLAEGASTTDGETVDTYRVMCDVIPSDTHYRMRRETPRPRIRGPQTALVVGASGSEIDTDQYGRILVKFYWDRSDTEDDQRTCRIRVSQTMAGNSWGSMVLPRVGQEVIVEYLEGNPDRPLVTGVLYNGTNAVPYALPDNQTRTTFKSNSSKGGGGFNEIRFEDKKDSEEVFFQAQKDYNKVVLNNETVTITQDTTTTVQKGNRSVTVSQGNDDHTVSQGNRTATISQGNESTTVSQGNRSVTVSTGNDTTTVSTGNHKLDVSSGTSEITAAQSITLTVGSNSIKIDTSGITINGMKITATATAGDIQATASAGSFEATGAMQCKLTGSMGMQLDGGMQISATAGMIALN